MRAKTLRFKKVPETSVRFEGEPDVDAVSGSERENLPDEVEPGVTYATCGSAGAPGPHRLVEAGARRLS